MPVERLAERYSSGIFQQWFNLDTKTDPRMPAGDLQSLISRFEQAYSDAVADVYQPKICISIIGTAFEVQRGARQTCSIFVGEDVKTQAALDRGLLGSRLPGRARLEGAHRVPQAAGRLHRRPARGDPALQRAQLPAHLSGAGHAGPRGLLETARAGLETAKNAAKCMALRRQSYESKGFSV